MTSPPFASSHRSSPRIVTPEILDQLPPGDPAALHNRRDLRIINRAMGNERWFQRTLRAHLRPNDRVVELGAGTGELGRLLAGIAPTIDGIDRWPRPEAWPANGNWHQVDLLTFKDWSDYSVAIGNMIFHQFDARELRKLGMQLAENVRTIAACEPARRRRFQWLLAAICPLIGANHVSRHDGRVSIAAGFLGDELPMLLGLNRTTWRWGVTTTPLGAYRFVAEKIS